MPKTISATSVEIQRWLVCTDPVSGDVDGITVMLLVNYGTEADPQNHSEEFDLWNVMNVGERIAFQRSVFDRLNSEITAAYLT